MLNGSVTDLQVKTYNLKYTCKLDSTLKCCIISEDNSKIETIVCPNFRANSATHELRMCLVQMGDVSNILSTQHTFMEVAYALPLLSHHFQSLKRMCCSLDLQQQNPIQRINDTYDIYPTCQDLTLSIKTTISLTFCIFLCLCISFNVSQLRERKFKQLSHCMLSQASQIFLCIFA